MHELVFCENIVRILHEQYKKLMKKKEFASGVRIERVGVALGELHQIVPESLLAAYEILTKDTPFAGSKLELRIIPCAVSCNSCGWNGVIKMPFFICKSCGKGDVDVSGGNELYIDNIEVEYDEH
jgi:hydrogenase nickel incorporation protein HypA/HybF